MRQIAEAILDGGIASVRFFNGRLLAAEDLTQEQTAHRAWRQRLGLALGDGVASGLSVLRGPGDGPLTPTLTVTPGLAVNRLGETVAVTGFVDLSLLGADAQAQATDARSVPGDFSCCQPPQQGTYVSGTGVYLLTVQPARGGTGRVAVSGLDNLTAACNVASDLEGVLFRLVPLDLEPPELSDPTLRNRVAHDCLGTAETRAAWVDPVNRPLTTYGRLDDLRPDRLTDADVPLALIDWTEDAGIAFIDAWAVRRRLTRPAAQGPWAQELGDRRAAEAEAAFLQFQDHVRDLIVGGSSPESARAFDTFRFLPPAGVLPLSGPGGYRGLTLAAFFQGLTTRSPVVIEGARVESLLTAALAYPPIDLTEKEVIRVYLVRQNLQPPAPGAAAPPPLAVFAGGQIPDHGQARYDIARWGFANYS